MEQISTLGVDIAKNVFQVHGINERGEIVVRRQLRRRQVLPFFGRLFRALSAWKPAPHRTTGHGRLRSAPMRCG